MDSPRYLFLETQELNTVFDSVLCFQECVYFLFAMFCDDKSLLMSDSV